MKVLWRAARWLLLGIALLVGLILLPLYLDEVERTVLTLTQANPAFLALGFGAAVLWIFAFGLLIRESGVAVGRKLPVRRSALLGSALQFIYAFPAGSVAGLVYETQVVSRMGVPLGTAMLIVGVETVVFYGTFILFLVAGVFVLALSSEASGTLVLGVVILVAVVAGIALAALYILGDPIRAQAMHERLQGIFGRGRGVGRSVDEVALAVQRIRESPRILVKPLAAALAMWTSLLLCLGLVFLAFGHLPHPAVAVTALAVGFFAGRITPIPGGLGAVEGAMVATFTGLDVAFGLALTVTLAFRVLTFLIPALLGFAAHHVLARFVDPDLDAVVPLRPGSMKAESGP